MKSRSFFIFLGIFPILFASCGRQSKESSVSSLETKKNDGFFVEVPIPRYSSTQSPCIDVWIEGKLLSMELDLGLQGDLTLEEDWIDQIETKTFLRTKTMYGIQGTEYPTHLFRVPKVKIGNLVFLDSVLQQNGQNFSGDSVFVNNGEEPSKSEPGRLGWELFHNTNLLIDLVNSRICGSDSIATLKNHGLFLKTFSVAPLYTDRGLLEFDVDCSLGSIRCVLDSGCTWNLLHVDRGDSIKQMIWEPENILECTDFNINGIDFESVAFHQVPIRLPIQIDAILGMEFFRDHLVFINFSERLVYISKYE